MGGERGGEEWRRGAKRSKEERRGAKRSERRVKKGNGGDTNIGEGCRERLGKAIKGRTEGDMESATWKVRQFIS
jgi:hypothetical protein